jgi:hypothetical protein
VNVETVPIDSIHVDPANVRVHPERNLSAIKASLARFGQQKPIVIDESGIVRAGNGTLEAARALGWETVNVVRTPLTGSEATAYAIADNRTAELAEWDDTALATTLRALQSEDFNLSSVGYSDEELQGLIDRIGGELVDDPQGEWEGMPEFENEDKKPFQSIIVHFHTEHDLVDFAALVNQKITSATKFINFPWRPNEHFGMAETQAQ